MLAQKGVDKITHIYIYTKYEDANQHNGQECDLLPPVPGTPPGYKSDEHVSGTKVGRGSHACIYNNQTSGVFTIQNPSN